MIVKFRLLFQTPMKSVSVRSARVTITMVPVRMFSSALASSLVSRPIFMIMWSFSSDDLSSSPGISWKELD